MTTADEKLTYLLSQLKKLDRDWPGYETSPYAKPLQDFTLKFPEHRLPHSILEYPHEHPSVGIRRP